LRALVAFALAAVQLLAQHAERASAYIEAGDLKNAEAELRKAIAQSPDDPALLTSLGGVLGMQGDLKQAIIYLAKAVKLRPGDPLLRRNLAANQWQLGRFREAHENLDILIRANPQDKAAIFLLGMVCENEKDYKHSIALLESIPEITERRPEAVVALASSYYHVGRQAEGRSALLKIAGSDINPQVAFMAGRVAMEAQDYPLAERFFSAAESTYSDPSAVKFQLALAQYRQGRADDSERALRRAIDLKQAKPETYVLLCNVLAGRGANTEALQHAADAANLYPDSAEVFSTKAGLEMKLQNYSAAVGSFQRAEALKPSTETQRELALAEWRAGDKQRAAADFEKVISRYPRDAEARQVYGTLLLEDGSAEGKSRAIVLFKQATAIDPSSVEALYNLGNLALADGELKQAAEYLEKAVQSDASQSRLHFALSRVYRRMGRASDADSEMQKYQNLKQAERASAQ
jgi:tetratricopeptide (TPR) repeat protein